MLLPTDSKREKGNTRISTKKSGSAVKMEEEDFCLGKERYDHPHPNEWTLIFPRASLGI